MHFIKNNVTFLAVIVVFVLLPLLCPNPGTMGMFINCGVASVLAMGWLMFLRIGVLSLGQVAFLAIGAYTSALLYKNLGISPWIGLFAGGVTAGFVALVIGLIFLKVRGLSMAIITFAFAEVVRLVISNIKFLGGHGGIMDIPNLPSLHLPGLGEIAFQSPMSNYYVILAITLISALFMWRMDKSAYGRTFRAIAQNEDLVRSLGVHPLRYKVIAFVTACSFAGVAGAFTANYFGCLYPGSYTVMHSVFVQIQGTVGGAASVALGGILGGSLLVIIEHWLISVDARLIYIFYGLVIILVTFFLPDGLLSIPGEVRKYLRKG